MVYIVALWKHLVTLKEEMQLLGLSQKKLLENYLLFIYIKFHARN